MTDIDQGDVRYKKIRPLISYYGGKQRMASRIVPLLPEHTVYVEPFAGGAAVLFAKPWPNTKNSDHYREVINDQCSDLMNLYDVAKTHPEELGRWISLTPYGREAHERSRLLLQSENTKKLDRAWAYYTNIQQGFAHNKHGGWGTGVLSMNPSARWNRIDSYSPLSRLRSVHIENRDALSVIKTWDSPQTLFYCDPPYVNTNCGHYKGFSLDDYRNLLLALEKCSGSVVLSGYKIPEVGIPNDWESFVFTSHCSASGVGKSGGVRDKGKRAPKSQLGNRSREEIVYRRFNTQPWRPELEKLRQAGVYSCFARNPKEVSAPVFNPPTAAPSRSTWTQTGMNL